MKGRTRFAARRAGQPRETRLEIGQEVELTLEALPGVSGILLAFSDQDRCLVEVGIVERGVLLKLPRQAIRSRFEP